MAIQKKYLSEEQNLKEKGSDFFEVYYGTLEECNELLATLKPSTFINEKGVITNVKISQNAAGIYELSVSYSVEIDDAGNASNPSSTSGPKTQKLSARSLSLSLETHKDYKTKWNYYLIGLGEKSGVVPTWWTLAVDTFIDPSSDDFKNYRWIKSLSEMPTEKNEDGKYWQIVKGSITVKVGNQDVTKVAVCKPQKPGVESFDVATFVISESAKFNTKNKAGKAAKKINSIFDRPTLGDFGIGGGNWKLDGVEVYHDGKNWIGEQTFTQSGDEFGWDEELYKKETGKAWL